MSQNDNNWRLRLSRRPGESFLIDQGNHGRIWMLIRSSVDKVCHVTLFFPDGRVQEYHLNKSGNRNIEVSEQVSVYAETFRGTQVTFAFRSDKDIRIVRSELLSKEEIEQFAPLDVPAPLLDQP
ncbi:hypothetical protein ACFQDL_32635 [Marinobacterium aestuariivivens]|uniref:Uncharacterized protein n=1 Tax=Marinobacterium aestuariivivens TaxID=1698799 RepID=A0ABW2AA78_9GAMM